MQQTTLFWPSAASISFSLPFLSHYITTCVRVHRLRTRINTTNDVNQAYVDSDWRLTKLRLGFGFSA